MNSRLDNATYPGVGLVDYNYDWVGNRVNPPAPPNPMEFNAADQHTRWPAQHQYEYWLTGSLHKEYDDASPRNLQKTYTYAAADLLASVQHAGDGTSSMAWDADANRVGFTSSSGGASTYVYDATAGVPAVFEESTGSGTAYYVRDPNGSLIARISGGGTRYYHFDELGSTRLLTDANGSVTDRYVYDAWGNSSHEALGGSISQPYQYVGESGYYTHCQDANLALLQLGVRFYDPQTGRFSQRDPVGSHRVKGAYAYVAGNPLAWLDPGSLAKGAPDRGWCQNLLNRISTLTQLLLLHYGMDECCGGPNKGHFKEEQQMYEKLERLRDQYRDKCQGRWKMPPLPEPVPEPVPEKPKLRRCEIDPEKCGQAAKGICWGVVIYWTISELSRILCPPRNLLPIP